jgi:3-hydroxyacyl-[acyl-carrier-protein] dehydratase
MRWFWIDRYLEFESGRSATAVKAVSLAEDHLHDHFPSAPIMPNSLILEGMAQTAGLLVAEHYRFELDIVLAKVGRAVFHVPALPGSLLTYRAKVEDLKDDGAFVSVTSSSGEQLQGEAEIFFGCLQRGASGRQLFEPAGLTTWLRTLRVFEVGRGRDGQPLTEPSEAVSNQQAVNGKGASA